MTNNNFGAMGRAILNNLYNWLLKLNPIRRSSKITDNDDNEEITNFVVFESTKVKAELRKRTYKDEGCGDVAVQCLEKYFYLMEEGRSTLNLTMQEALVILDALNGSIVFANEGLVRSAWISIQSAIEYHQLDKAWNIDGSALVEKIKNLSLMETFALVDACERFWHGNNEGADVRLRVYEVGLVKKDLEEF